MLQKDSGFKKLGGFPRNVGEREPSREVHGGHGWLLCVGEDGCQIGARWLIRLLVRVGRRLLRSRLDPARIIIKSLFQAVLCVTPKNPIISATVESMIHYWYHKLQRKGDYQESWPLVPRRTRSWWIHHARPSRKVILSNPYQKELVDKIHASFMGPSTVWKAWQGLTTASHWLLEEEIDLRSHRGKVYPNWCGKILLGDATF